MVAKSLSDNKPKSLVLKNSGKWIRTIANFIDLIQFISFSVSNVGEIFWGWIQKDQV